MTDNKDDCRVYTTTLTAGYPMPNPPYNNCIIVCGLQNPPALMETFLFNGTYEACEKFVQKNCVNCNS